MNSVDSENLKSSLRLDWAIIMFMIIQTSGAIWWAATITTSQNYMRAQLDKVERKTESRYTSEQAEAAWKLQFLKNLQNDAKNLEQDKRIERLLSKVFNIPSTGD